MNTELMLEDLSVLVNDIEARIHDIDHLELLQSRTELSISSLTEFAWEKNLPSLNELLLILSALYQIISKELRQFQYLPDFQVATDKKGEVGRPKFEISKDTLVDLRDFGYTWTEISSMLLVSRWTLQRRVKEFGIRNIVSYSIISDDELDEHVRAAKEQFGILSGRSMVTGFLNSMGLRIQRRRIVKSLIRVDPTTSRLRWACLIKRRKYSVPGPNSLWHADGHHSLINWGFVIHGAIDGHSRLIVYLKCNTNNRAATVYDNFVEAIDKFGVPSRLRTDKGGENQLLWEEMERLRGCNRGSYIAGSSVHNQRIERLWRDVWTYVTHEYYYTFQSLEVEGLIYKIFFKFIYISFLNIYNIIVLMYIMY